jgi:hypothetical protein
MLTEVALHKSLYRAGKAVIHESTANLLPPHVAVKDGFDASTQCTARAPVLAQVRFALEAGLPQSSG